VVGADDGDGDGDGDSGSGDDDGTVTAGAGADVSKPDDAAGLAARSVEQAVTEPMDIPTTISHPVRMCTSRILLLIDVHHANG
jgi:hypothetical protein